MHYNVLHVKSRNALFQSIFIHVILKVAGYTKKLLEYSVHFEEYHPVYVALIDSRRDYYQIFSSMYEK